MEELPPGFPTRGQRDQATLQIITTHGPAVAHRGRTLATVPGQTGRQAAAAAMATVEKVTSTWKQCETRTTADVSTSNSPPPGSWDWEGTGIRDREASRPQLHQQTPLLDSTWCHRRLLAICGWLPGASGPNPAPESPSGHDNVPCFPSLGETLRFLRGLLTAGGRGSYAFQAHPHQ